MSPKDIRINRFLGCDSRKNLTMASLPMKRATIINRDVSDGGHMVVPHRRTEIAASVGINLNEAACQCLYQCGITGMTGVRQDRGESRRAQRSQMQN